MKLSIIPFLLLHLKFYAYSLLIMFFLSNSQEEKQCKALNAFIRNNKNSPQLMPIILFSHLDFFSPCDS